MAVRLLINSRNHEQLKELLVELEDAELRLLIADHFISERIDLDGAVAETLQDIVRQHWLAGKDKKDVPSTSGPASNKKDQG